MSNPKGISILIPIYNVDVRKLVHELDRQGQQTNLPFEVLCFDDFSMEEVKKLNQEISSLPSVRYKELLYNFGRSKIRNQLADSAKYSHLLFLDCDCSIPTPSFLQNYILQIDKPLVIGGRNYHEEKPTREFILHWTVGKAREQRSAEERNKFPYQSFMSNNFMIEKNLYLRIRLDEKLEGYGHEDTKFGYELQRQSVPLYHIDNPVIHEELDSTIQFLNKTKEGLKNFYKITQEGYGKDTKLYKSYTFLRKSNTTKAFLFSYSLVKNKIEENLQSSSPTLAYFDLYKLYYLIKESTQ